MCTAATSVVGVRLELALEVLHHVGRDHRDLAQVDRARGAVDRDHVALADDEAVGPGELLLGRVDLELLGAADAGLAHAPGDHGRVAGLAAAAGQHALGRDHAVQVLGVGLAADEDDLLAAASAQATAVAESNTALPTAAPGEAEIAVVISDDVAAGVEAGEHQPGELGPGDPGERLVEVDHALLDQLGRDPEGRRRRSACRPGSAASRACRARW